MLTLWCDGDARETIWQQSGGYDPIAAMTDRFLKVYPSFSLAVVICGGCGNENLFVRKSNYVHGGIHGDSGEETQWLRKVHPVGRALKPFRHVPAAHLEMYGQACQTLTISPSASACMSRRCLQAILREQGYEQQNLAKQIDALLTETIPNKVLSPVLQETVDAIRNFGNFAAHPINDVTTAQIIEVEEGEAEWCIELTEELLDHYYERPALAKQRLAAANLKMKAGGKPPLKV